jgi:hypothetical protein
MAYEYPAYGQACAANELKKQSTLISSGGIWSIWLRHGLEIFKKRLVFLEEKATKEGLVYTESPLVALESAKRERESSPDEIETAHPGYLISQDTFYVGYLKGVGRIYQQTVVDTYSSVAFAKVYTAKVPVTATDTLNDRVIPFFEQQEIPVLRVITDRGTEFCGTPDKHPMSFICSSMRLNIQRQRCEFLRPMAFVKDFIRRFLMSFTGLFLERKNTAIWKSCKLIWRSI